MCQGEGAAACGAETRGAASAAPLVGDRAAPTRRRRRVICAGCAAHQPAHARTHVHTATRYYLEFYLLYAPFPLAHHQRPSSRAHAQIAHRSSLPRPRAPPFPELSTPPPAAADRSRPIIFRRPQGEQIESESERRGRASESDSGAPRPLAAVAVGARQRRPSERDTAKWHTSSGAWARRPCSSGGSSAARSCRPSCRAARP